MGRKKRKSFLGGKGCLAGKAGGGGGFGHACGAALGRPGLSPEAGAPPTCGDAVELPQRQVLHLVLSEAGWAGAVDGGRRGVGVGQPLHQPLHLAVAVE